MANTTKVSLNNDNSLGYGHLLYCCGKRQSVNIDTLDNNQTWHCAICDRPLMIKYDDQYFAIRENITI
ncbi:hypothetical protein J2W97_002270 [Paenibacillus jamilae]|nr:hypothetical protein [Paenibacillus jamilae]